MSMRKISNHVTFMEVCVTSTEMHFLPLKIVCKLADHTFANLSNLFKKTIHGVKILNLK